MSTSQTSNVFICKTEAQSKHGSIFLPNRTTLTCHSSVIILVFLCFHFDSGEVNLTCLHHPVASFCATYIRVPPET